MEKMDKYIKNLDSIRNNTNQALTNLNQLKIMILDKNFDIMGNHEAIKQSFEKIINEIRMIQNIVDDSE